MNHILENFERLLEKFKFRNPVPYDIQDLAISSSKTSLIKILKYYEDYNFVFKILLDIYFTARRLKIRINFIQSKVILLFLTLSTAALILIGGYLLINVLSEALPGNNNAALEIHEAGNSKTPVEDNYLTKDNPITNYIIGVNEFSGPVDDSQKITKIIFLKLQNSIGLDKVTSMNAIKRNRVGKVLIGSVGYLGEDKYINIKVIDTVTSKLEYAASEKVSSEDELENVCTRIADNIASEIE